MQKTLDSEYENKRYEGGEWTHAYMWLSPFAVHLKLSHHC